MNPVQKALWFAEHKLNQPVSLEAMASHCEVSTYYLTRAFSEAMGISLMRYIRARRLTEAARKLANGADDILSLALDTGYSSHEAFTRAIGEQFGFTPEQIRQSGTTHHLQLMEPIVLNNTDHTTLEPHRIEKLTSLIMAGYSERFNCQNPAGIPNLWQRFSPHLGRIPGQIGQVAYGVCSNFDESGCFDYLAAVQVGSQKKLPDDFTTITLPASSYIVFTHRGHIAGIRSTIAAIWKTGIPESGVKITQAPSFERYGMDFNPQTGMGNVEIWIPTES